MPNVEIEEDEMRAADLMSKFISTFQNTKMKKKTKNFKKARNILKEIKKSQNNDLFNIL